jgi:hypothetical protein
LDLCTSIPSANNSSYVPYRNEPRDPGRDFIQRFPLSRVHDDRHKCECIVTLAISRLCLLSKYIQLPQHCSSSYVTIYLQGLYTLTFCLTPLRQTGQAAARLGLVRSCCRVGLCCSLHHLHMTKCPQGKHATSASCV